MGAEHRNRHLNGLLILTVCKDHWPEVIIPGRHKQHDGIGDNCRLAEWQEDSAICAKVGTAIDLGCIQITGRQANHKLAQEEDVVNIAK